MKKKYIIPEIILVKLRCEKMVSTSIVYDEEQTTSTQYVKEDQSSSNPGYNVWNDDWSK